MSVRIGDRRVRTAIFMLCALLLTTHLPAQRAPTITGVDTWTTPRVDAPRVSYRTFVSRAARDTVSYHIYLPPAYDTDSTRRFPVLYWLHGTGGGLTGIRPLANLFDRSIREQRIPPMLVVFVNGMTNSMWVDAKDGSVPMETVIVRELVPAVDASHRTIARREGRVVEGFSMGGYGAARFGFAHSDVFAGASILAGGPLDLDFAGPRAVSSPLQRERIFRTVYGSDLSYYRQVSPYMLAERHRERIRERLRIRIVVGDRDNTAPLNRQLHEHLTKLGIVHEFVLVPGVGHSTPELFTALGDGNWKFYRDVFRN